LRSAVWRRPRSRKGEGKRVRISRFSIAARRTRCRPTGLCRHADFDAMVLEQLVKAFARELVSLRIVEDLRLVILGNRFFKRFDTENRAQVLGISVLEGSQIGHTAEYIQRQVTVAVIITVKVSSLLSRSLLFR